MDWCSIYPNIQQYLLYRDWMAFALPNDKNYSIMYTLEKLKSLKKTLDSRNEQLKSGVDAVDKIIGVIKEQSNTLDKVELLKGLRDTQNFLRRELSFNRAFNDEVMRQKAGAQCQTT